MKKYTKEADVKAEIRKILNELAVWYFMPSMNGYGRQGIPDFICCFKGHFLAIEAKFGGNKPTLMQTKELISIQAHGGTTLILDETLLDTLKPYLQAIIAMEK